MGYIDLLLIRAVGIQAGAELEIGSIVRAQLATVPVSYTHLDVYKRQVQPFKGDNYDVSETRTGFC